jgi:hypothetical protein
MTILGSVNAICRTRLLHRALPPSIPQHFAALGADTSRRVSFALLLLSSRYMLQHVVYASLYGIPKLPISDSNTTRILYMPITTQSPNVTQHVHNIRQKRNIYHPYQSVFSSSLLSSLIKSKSVTRTSPHMAGGDGLVLIVIEVASRGQRSLNFNR